MTENRTIKYLGGAYIDGVPARDLTPTEYEKFKAIIEACTVELYEVPEVKPSRKSKKEPGDK